MDGLIKKLTLKEYVWGSALVLILVVMLGFLTSRFDAYLMLAGVLAVAVSVFVYRLPFLGLLWITFFLPFERIGSYDVFGITVRASQLIALVLMVVWLAKGIVNKNLKPAYNPTTIPLLAFLLINLISLTNAVNLERSVLVFAFTVFTIFFSWIIPQYVKDKDKLKRIINILLITAALVSLFGIWQFFGDMIGLPTELTGLREHYTKDVFGFPRIQSTALEPLYFANFLLLPIALIYAFLLSRVTTVKQWWLFVLFVLLGVNMVLTVSRGGYLGTAVLLFIISLFYLKKVFHWKFILSFIIGIVVVWTVAVYALGFGDIFQLNFETFTEHVTNAFSGPAYVERIETFEWAQQAWLDEPWIGIGPGQYGPYVAAHPYVVPTEGWKIVNNEFIELLAETGLLGLITFLLVLAILVFRSIKAFIISQDPYLKTVMIALLAALFGIIAQYQTFSILYIMHIWFLIGLMVAVQNIILRKNKPISSPTILDTKSPQPPRSLAGLDPASPKPTKNISTNPTQS